MVGRVYFVARERGNTIKYIIIVPVMLRTLEGRTEDIYTKNITVTVRLPLTCYEMDSSNIALFTCT